jgi:hypothetical protein
MLARRIGGGLETWQQDKHSIAAELLKGGAEQGAEMLLRLRPNVSRLLAKT